MAGFVVTPDNKAKREAILHALCEMRHGQSMTFAQLTKKCGHLVQSYQDGQFAWARKEARKHHSVTLRTMHGKGAFLRLTHEQEALNSDRNVQIRRKATVSFEETAHALASNDKRVQAQASVTCAKFDMIRGIASKTNREPINDKLKG